MTAPVFGPLGSPDWQRYQRSLWSGEAIVPVQVEGNIHLYRSPKVGVSRWGGLFGTVTGLANTGVLIYEWYAALADETPVATSRVALQKDTTVPLQVWVPCLAPFVRVTIEELQPA